MTMMAGYFTGQMPFKDVYIHGLVLDENGKKMSKSANNGIDPLLLIDKYGTDALRLALIREVVGAGQDIRLQYNRKTDESESVEASRNFTNKLWNAARFVMMNLEGTSSAALGQPNLGEMELADRWIWSRYQQAIQQTRIYIDKYGFGEAAKLLYEFFWGDFCDWYIELVKSRLQPEAPEASRQVAQQTLFHVLEGTLKLLHPFIPHITAEIWETLTGLTDLDLSLQPYPIADVEGIDTALEQEFELSFGVIRTIRNLRAEADIKPSIKANIVLQSDNAAERQALLRSANYICDTAKVEDLQVVAAAETDGRAIAGIHATVQVILPLTGVVDIGAFKVKLEKKLAKIQREAESSTNKLQNGNFVDRALPEVVQEVRDNLVELTKQIEILQARIASL
jgi:valyl-tRNA synthetase